MTQLSSEEIDDVLYDSRSGDLETVKEFFNGKGPAVLSQIKDEYSESTPIHMASANGHIAVLQYLLQIARESGNKEIINALNDSGNTALHWASLNGHLETVKLLCDEGADPFLKNKSGQDSFYTAEVNGKEEVIDYLLGKYSVEPVEDDELDVVDEATSENDNNPEQMDQD
jgi:uncharacterized protein